LGGFFSVVCLQRLQAGNVQKLLFKGAMQGNVNNVHPIFPITVYYLDIPWLRTETILCQDNGILFRQLQKTGKMFETLRKVVFLDPFGFGTVATEPGGGLSRRSAFMLLLRNTSKV